MLSTDVRLHPICSSHIIFLTLVNSTEVLVFRPEDH